MVDHSPCTVRHRDTLRLIHYHEAVLKGDVEKVRSMVHEMGNMSNFTGLTPMHMAIEGDHVEIVRIFLEYPKFVWDPLRALYHAAELGRVDIGRCIVRAQGPGFVDGEYSLGGNSALYVAAAKNHLSFVRFLVLEAGAKVNTINQNGFGPLHISARQGHVDVVTFFLGMPGIDVDRGWVTPLFLATMNRHMEVIDVLVHYGKAAVVPVQYGFESTPLYLAIQRLQDGLVDMFLKNISRADMNRKDVRGRTLLQNVLRLDPFPLAVVRRIMYAGGRLSRNHHDMFGPHDGPVLKSFLQATHAECLSRDMHQSMGSILPKDLVEIVGAYMGTSSPLLEMTDALCLPY